MNDSQYKRLQPYLSGKMARSRLILFLIAVGKSVNDICEMTLSDLSVIMNSEKLPIEIIREYSLYMENLKEREGNKKAFSYPNGRKLNARRVLGIFQNALGEKFTNGISEDMFSKYIIHGKKLTLESI